MGFCEPRPKWITPLQDRHEEWSRLRSEFDSPDATSEKKARILQRAEEISILNMYWITHAQNHPSL